MGLKLVSVDGGAGRLASDKTVVFGFAVVNSTGVELHRFEARYSQLKSLHDDLHDQGVFEQFGVPHSGGLFSSTFPPPYRLKDMKTPENRAIRGSELRRYLSSMLLAHPGVWERDEVLDALNIDRASAVTVATALNFDLCSEGEATEATLLTRGSPGDIPAHIRGRWLHDGDASDDLEPLLAATGRGWLGHEVAKERSPAVHLFFTDTHLVVVEGDGDLEQDDRSAGLAEAAISAMTKKTEEDDEQANLATNRTYGTLVQAAAKFHGEAEGRLRGNVTRFSLSGEEEVFTRTVNGEEEKISTKYWSNGDAIKTWTWLWDARGKNKRWTIVSERKAEGDTTLYAPSFSEHVCFLPLDSPTIPVVTLQRRMSRDVQHIARALPQSLQGRMWRPNEQIAHVASRGIATSAPNMENATDSTLADEARSQRVAKLRADSAVDRTTESVAVPNNRERDVPLTATRAEAQQAENNAEARKRAVLADTLKRAAELQERIAKITEAAAVAGTYSANSAPNLENADSRQLTEQPRSQRVARSTDWREDSAVYDTTESVARSNARERDVLLAATRTDAQRAAAGAGSGNKKITPQQPPGAMSQSFRSSSSDSKQMPQPPTFSSAKRVTSTQQPPGAMSQRFRSSSSDSKQMPQPPTFSSAKRVTSTPRAPGDGKKRRAKQPLAMLEHGDLRCTTEWWQPGCDGGPDARLEDVLGRAALASGDPKAMLENLILSSKTVSLKSELHGMGERELEVRARDLGITALDILKAEAVDAGCTDEEITEALLAGETDPNSNPTEELKRLIRDRRRRKLQAEKQDFETMASGLGITVAKAMEIDAAQRGFCLGDVQIKACLEGTHQVDAGSIWISVATDLTREVPMSGPVPPVHKKPTLIEVDDGPIGALMKRVLDMQHQGQYDTEPWLEKWVIGSEATRDDKGEKLVHELAQTLRTNDTAFNDPGFPPTDDSISKRGDFLTGVHEVEWKRASEIGAISGQSVKTLVFADDIDPNDISQGNIGDCYFLAALAALASATDDHLLKDLIIEDGQDVGMFGVKFFVSGRWITVIVDDWFPCVQNDEGTWQPLFARSNHHSAPGTQTVVELWVMVFEKAWAKLHGSFQAIEGGFTEDALNYLTGGRSFQFDFAAGSDDWNDMIALLKRGNENESKMAFMTTQISSNGQHSSIELEAKGLCAGHAYTVLDAVELPTGDRILHLRNPWGSFEWNGAWCDSDPRWTAELRSVCRMALDHCDDGAFCISLEDFTTYFCSVGVCDPFELVAEDNSGDGRLDTAVVSAMRIGDGEVATVECGQAKELVVTTYQADTRGRSTPLNSVQISVQCSAFGNSWIDVVSFSRRTYCRTVSLGTEMLHVSNSMPVHSSPRSEEELLEMLLPDDSDSHNTLEGLILKKAEADLLIDLDQLDLKGLRGAAVEAAKENGNTDEIEAQANAVLADDDPTGVLASLIVEHANLMARFNLSGWNLEKLRQKARELGFTDERIAATEAAGESNPDSSPREALLQLILDALATLMRNELDGKNIIGLLDDAKKEGLDLDAVHKSLESDNPKAALLAMILERTKAAEGNQMVEIDSPAVKQGRTPQQRPLPSRHRRRMAQIKAAIQIQAAWRAFSTRSGGASYSARNSYAEVAALLHSLNAGMRATQ